MMDNLRGIHDKYDVIMLLIILVWSDSFLEFMGIDLKINKVLSTKHSTHYGERRLMDFIFRGMDCKIYNLEFDFPRVTHKRMSRYFFYNILAETIFKGIVESIIINFTRKTNNSSLVYHSGFSKSFHPRQFYIGDCDFRKHFRNIKKKVKSYNQTNNITKLTPLEELALLLQSVVHG